MKNKLLILALPLFFTPACAIAQSQWSAIECYGSLGSTVTAPTTLFGSDVFLDRNGSPWVVYESSNTVKLGHVVNGEWTFSQVPENTGFPPMPYNSINKVAFDTYNTAWVMVSNQFSRMLYSYTDGIWQAVEYTENITDVRTDIIHPGVYMVFDNAVKRFYQVNPSTQTTLYLQPLASTPIKKLAPDNDGGMVLYKQGSGTDSLVMLNLWGDVTASYDITAALAALGENHIRHDMKVSSDGHLWFYLSSGYVHTLVEFNGDQHTVYQLNSPASMPDAMCHNMVMENDVIWLYYDGHVTTFSNGQFQSQQVMQAPSWNTFGYSEMNFRKDGQDNIWYIGRIPPVGEFALCVVNPHGLSTITGRTFLDANENGLFDTGEAPASFTIQTPDGFTLPTEAGHYGVFGFDPGQQVSLTAIPPQYYQLTTPATITVVPAVGPLDGLDFGIRPTAAAQDLYVTQTSSACRPGFNVTQWVSYGNRGNQVTDASIAYTYDPQLVYTSALPLPDDITDNTLTWNHDALAPFTDSTITVFFQLGAQASISDTLFSNATIGPTATDTLPADNSFAAADPITGSYDPNDKTATPEATAMPGQWIDYRIRFQNTGNDTAFNIYLLDTLSLLFDLGSLSVIGHSHPMRHALTGNVLEFWFDNILLPDTFTNEPLSHGFVQYRIRTSANLLPTQEVRNTAYIYFDFNQPIITNTTVNTMPEPDNVFEAEIQRIWNVYPNPNDGTFQILLNGQAKGSVRIELFDLQGRSLLHQQWPASTRIGTLDARALASGCYLLSVVVDGQRSTSRLVIR